MFNILKKLFMLEIYKKTKTIHINWAIQLTIIEIVFVIYFQYIENCSRSLNQVINTMSYQWINNKSLLEEIPQVIKWNITISWRYCEHNYTRLTHENKLEDIRIMVIKNTPSVTNETTLFNIYMIYNLIMLSTLLIKKGSHNWSATLNTLAVVWTLWSFKILIWFKLCWWALKEPNGCCPQIDRILYFLTLLSRGLLIKKCNRKWYTTLITLAVVWALRFFKIFIISSKLC